MASSQKTTASPQPKAPSDRVDAAEFLAGAKELDQFPPPVVAEVAFAGRSNVGKSSLMNALLERRGLVRTSGTPGCTRQISWFHARAGDGAELCLTDLPGYGYAKRSKEERRLWASIIEGYLLERPTLRGVAILVDVRRGFEDDESELIELLQGPARVSRPPLSVLLVATKIDKLSHSAQKPALEAVATSAKARGLSGRVHGFSAETGQGRVELWRAVRRAIGVTS